ncbi:MAG: phosphoglucosamine mutase [Bacteroidetes bacterium]|nr:phosphoglucosamine mutase [Bacteroidota bacterium]
MVLIKSISGIRGTIGGAVGEGLNPPDVVGFVTAYTLHLSQGGSNKPLRVVVGRDARISGQMVGKIVSGTLMSLGVEVIDLGLATTPTVEIAVPFFQADGGIILTASHNPKHWNALKLLDHQGEFLSEEAGKQIQAFAEAGTFVYPGIEQVGSYRMDDTLLDFHIQQILSLDLVDVEAIRKKKFCIAVDAVNSVGGIAVPRLLNALGVAEIHELNCMPDGHFAHNPEPIPPYLDDLAKMVIDKDADLGIAVDPDVDRLALVTEEGELFGEEYTLVAVADYILQHTPGNTVSNLSSSRALKEVTEKYGQTYEASAVGEVHVVKKMKEIGAIIGGEGNGGIIYPALHYGRDALAGIALFLTWLAKSGKSCAALRDLYPKYVIAKSRIELQPGIDLNKILHLISEQYKNHPQNTVDGLRIEFGREWVHLRKSNTEPIIRIYAESDASTKADHLARKLIADIGALINK